MKPTIAVTLGDPAGVGPEIVARVCVDPEVRKACRLLVVGRRSFLAAGARAYGLSSPKADVTQAGEADDIAWGRPSASSGRQAGAFIEKALELCQDGTAQAMVTAPISKAALKAAGYPDTGHTTMLARLTSAPRPVMMLAGARLRVVPVTVHIALKEVFARLTTDKIVETGQIAADDLARFFGLPRPRVAVAALNPHAGEEGLFGDEEKRVIAPAIEELKNRGIAATGPHPPDTVFWRAAAGQFDLVLGMYHDQALIPLKLIHFEDAVNVTLGLPVIRTSVDHGTAYDIAGQGKANPASLKAAVLMAAGMALKAAAD